MTWQYRWFMASAALGVTVQALLIVALLVQRARRRRTEVALRASQTRHMMATAAGRVGVWDWNLQTNDFYEDPSLRAILGCEDREIRNVDDWLKLVHPDDAPHVMPRVREHLEGRSPSCELEYRRMHRDGSVYWFLKRGAAVSLDGRPVRIIGTDTDITERKKSEQALLEAQADLARLSRLNALGEFAASIAHEVRQPLTAIIMNARSCLRGIAGGAPDLTEVRDGLLDVVDASQHAEAVIQRNRELFRDHTAETTLDTGVVESHSQRG